MKFVIYSFQCKTENVGYYIGSTRNLKARILHHKYCCENENSINYNKKLYRTIRENGGFDNWVFVKLFKSTDFTIRYEKEREYIELMKVNNDKVLNKNYPNRTIQEWKELKVFCPFCSKSYRIDNITHHYKTYKHINNKNL